MQTTEEATVFVRELDLFVTVMLLENTLAVLSLGNSAKNLGLFGPVARNELIRNGNKFIATYQIMYQRVPSHRLISPTSSSQETVTDTENSSNQKSEKYERGFIGGSVA